MKLHPRKLRLDVFNHVELMEIGMELLHSRIRAEKKLLREEGITLEMLVNSDFSCHQRFVHDSVNRRLVGYTKEVFDYINQKWEVQSE